MCVSVFKGYLKKKIKRERDYVSKNKMFLSRVKASNIERLLVLKEGKKKSNYNMTLTHSLDGSSSF